MNALLRATKLINLHFALRVIFAVSVIVEGYYIHLLSPNQRHLNFHLYVCTNVNIKKSFVLKLKLDFIQPVKLLFTLQIIVVFSRLGRDRKNDGSLSSHRL